MKSLMTAIEMVMMISVTTTMMDGWIDAYLDSSRGKKTKKCTIGELIIQ